MAGSFTAATRFAWLLFGNAPYAASGESYILAQTGYVPPLILYQIATDRSAPYVHREYKRTRHRIRNSTLKNAPVYKYTSMRREYVFGSSQGGSFPCAIESLRRSPTSAR